MRVVQGESTYYGHVDGLAEEDLLRVAERVPRPLRGAAREPGGLAAAATAGGHAIGTRPDEVEAARKADLLRACDERARSLGPEVAQARIGYAESRRQVEVFNSEGRAAADDRTRSGSAPRWSPGATAGSRPAPTPAGGTPARARGGDPAAVAEKAARRALGLLDAVDAPTGRLPVVVGNGFGGVLLHEAVGHGLEADAVQSAPASTRAPRRAARRALRHRLRRRPARDDSGSDGIDDEAPTRRTTVIEDGRLVAYLYDVVSARKDRVSATGNGRRGSFRHLPAAAMTNTCFAPGEDTPEGLIAEIERGLYAVSSAAARSSPPPATSYSASRRAI